KDMPIARHGKVVLKAGDCLKLHQTWQALHEARVGSVLHSWLCHGGIISGFALWGSLSLVRRLDTWGWARLIVGIVWATASMGFRAYVLIAALVLQGFSNRLEGGSHDIALVFRYSSG